VSLFDREEEKNPAAAAAAAAAAAVAQIHVKDSASQLLTTQHQWGSQ
jgi:hypothetical protein